MRQECQEWGKRGNAGTDKLRGATRVGMKPTPGAPHAAATQRQRRRSAPLRAPGRMQPRGLLLLLALLLLAVTTEAGKAKKDKAKKDGSECQDWRWGPCVPNSKDCGLGYREGTCGDESKKLKCKIPCNWKKKFGADCKYKFESWGGCSAQTGVKTRSGILKKALYNAQCEEIVYVSKPCASKMKSKSKAKKGKGKD